MITDFIKDYELNFTDSCCSRYIKRSQSKLNYDELCKALEAHCDAVQQTVMGENFHTTYSSGKENIIISYYDYNHTISVICDNVSGNYKSLMTGFNHMLSGFSKLCIMSLKYSRELNPGNGINMIFTLSDGRYIVYDGGYERDAEATLEYLGKNATVAAWILTHGHDDHCGCIKEIAEKYSNDIKLEHIICTPDSKCGCRDANASYLTDDFIKMLLKAFPGSRFIRPYTGQKLYFANAEIEILLTFEENTEKHFNWLNEASLITRINIENQSILMAADTEKASDSLLTSMYGNYLKSDILQVPHHGYSGGSKLMYDLIAPEIAIWTTDEFEFSERILPTWSLAPNHYLAQMVKEYYIADKGNKELILPYNQKWGCLKSPTKN